MSEKHSKWRRSFRSKRTTQKKENKCSHEAEDKTGVKDDRVGSVPGLPPTGGEGTTCTSTPPATASSSQPHSEKGAPHKKSKALGAMRKLFSKLGKGKQKGKEPKPGEQPEIHTAANTADTMQNGGFQNSPEVQARARSRSRSRSQIPIATNSVRRPSPVRPVGVHGVRQGEKGTSHGFHKRRNSSPENQPLTPRSLAKWDSSSRLNIINDNREINQQGLELDIVSKQTSGGHRSICTDDSEVSRASRRSQFMDEQARSGISQGNTSMPSTSSNHKQSPDADLRSHHYNTHQGSQPKLLPRKDIRSGCVSMEQYRQGRASNGYVVPASPTRGGQGAGASPQVPRAQTSNLGPGPISSRSSDLNLPRPVPAPSHNSAPVYSDPAGSNSPPFTPPTEEDQEIRFIDDDNDVQEPSISIEAKRDEKISKTVERLTGKLRDLPPAFRTLLEAPLPARPWHPDSTRRGSHNPSSQQTRPASQTTQDCQKLPSQTTQPSVIHYHVTIQNSDGLDVNVKPTHTESSQSNDIVAKTVYTADGRQLKRLSWIEVSPVPLEDIGNKADSSKLGRDEPTDGSSIEIGSMSLGIDGSKEERLPLGRDMEGEVYFSEEAEKMFANQNEIIIAASVSPNNEPILNQIQKTNSREVISVTVRGDNKTDFPWQSRRTGSQSSLDDNNHTSSKTPMTKDEKGSPKKSKAQESAKQTSAGQRNEARKSPKVSGKALPRPNFKPGQRNASNSHGGSAGSLASVEGTFETSVGTLATKKSDRRRRSRPGSQNGENLSPPETDGVDSTIKASDSANDSNGDITFVKPSTSGSNTMNNDKTQTRSATVRPSIQNTTTRSSPVESSPRSVPISTQTSNIYVSQQNDSSQALCSECRNLRRVVPPDTCSHHIPSDIVARRRADFEKLVGGDDTRVDDEVTAMRVGPQTTFFKNAQCQTNTTDASDTGTTMKIEKEAGERRSRPVGRVAPNVRRSASVHSPITHGARWEARARSGSLQRHWSLSSVDTDIHNYSPPFYHTSRSNSTSSADWDNISIDTDLLTMETDRTLFETERTLREVEFSIQESRSATRAIRRAQRQLDEDVSMTSRRRSHGMSAERDLSDHDTRRRNLRLESEARVAEISARIQAQSLVHNLANAQLIPAAYPTVNHRRETACDKLTRIRENLIRVPGVLILGLRGGKIAVTMSPDRPHFEPIYRFMRENDVSMAEYECAVLAQRYRSPTGGGSTFIHQPITAPVLVR